MAPQVSTFFWRALNIRHDSATEIESEPKLHACSYPDDAITRFGEANNRYCIPFNAVYGSSAPEGIILSEILSTQDVLAALHAARPGAAQATLIEDDVKVSRFGNTLEISAD